MKQPKNNHEALVLALKLSITAATEEKSKQAVELAESIANNMTDIEIARAKKECMTQLEKEQWMNKILVNFEITHGEYESTEYVILRDNDWTDEDLLEEVYAPNGLYNKEYNYWEDDYGQRIIKVYSVQSIADEELKVLKKFNMVYDIWEDLHSPEKYNNIGVKTND